MVVQSNYQGCIVSAKKFGLAKHLFHKMLWKDPQQTSGPANIILGLPSWANFQRGRGSHRGCQGDLCLWQQDSENLWRVTIMLLSNPKGILRSAQA